jgi:hypothetical protein
VVVLDESVVCGEEVCVPGHRLYLERNIIILQQRLPPISMSPQVRGRTVSILQAHIASTSRARRMSTEGVDARALAVLMEAKMRAYSACVMKPIPQPANTDYAKGGVAGNAWIGVSCWRCFVVRCCLWLGKLRVGVVHACPRQSQSKAIPHGSSLSKFPR